MIKSLKKVFLICAVLAMLLLTGCTKEGYVANKVTVANVDIGGMTRDEAIAALETVALNPDEQVTIVADGETIVVTAGEIGAVYNSEKTADYAIEKSTGLFSGWFKKEYPMQVDADNALLDAKLKSVERDVVQASARVVENGIEVTNGTSGVMLEREKVYNELTEQFGAIEKKDIELDFIVTKPDEIDYESLIAHFVSEFKEAEYIRAADGTIQVTEESAGVVLDEKTAKEIMKEHSDEGEVYVIPCTVQLPVNTKADLEAKLFRDMLATYSTTFASSSENRCANIALASNSINGMIFMPGEEFSFNNALGERTVERGYKTAGAYAAGETVQQVGGGICQVSSTLYNSVLLSNLEITERRSHQMTVSYVPNGRDATVNWGTQDFKFKNNTKYPIKVVSTVSGKKISISIMGTFTIDNMKVEIETSTVSVLEPPVETVEDPSKEVGYTSTKNGNKGYVVDATRVVYSNGAEVSREKLTRSRYNPTKTIVTVGTKVVAPPVVETPVVETPVTPPVVETPVVETPVTPPVVEIPAVDPAAGM